MLAKQSNTNAHAVTVLILDLQQQNKELIKAITGFKKEEAPQDNGMMDFIKTLASSITSSNEAIKVMLEKKSEKPPDKLKAFKHTVHYNRGKMDYVESIEIDSKSNVKSAEAQT